MSVRSLVLVTTLSALAVAACGKNGSTSADAGAGDAAAASPDGAEDSGPTAADASTEPGDAGDALGAPDGADAPGPACNDNPNVATVIPIGISPDPVPVMTGGTITDGTYVETSVTDYGNDIQKTTMTKTTWVIAGTTLQYISSSNEFSAEGRYSMTFATAGNELTLTLTCPPNGDIGATYTATPTELRYITNDLSFELHVMAKL